MNTLIINTYGGSLLLGAKIAKANVIATMEDTGFGSDLQALNFPKVTRYEKRADWPEKFATAWRDIDVVAHPPCSAFSSVNYSNKKTVTMGTSTGAFACHQAVIDYALSHKARTCTIESVIGAYEGAHEEYEQNAEKYGYRVTYIMVNSASCGVPQWRERVWVIFHKLKAFKVAMKPEYVTLASVLKPGETSADFVFGQASLRRAWDGVRKTIKKSWPTGGIVTVLGKVHDMERDAARTNFGFSVYVNANPVLLDPDGFSPVLMQDGRLCVYDAGCKGGRALTVEEHCAIMGFPRDYKWGKQIKKFRMYLSKGVCPPVAAWILKTVDKNASGWTGPFTHEERDFGGVIDLRVKKAEALALANGRPWPPDGAMRPTRPTRVLSGPVIKARRDPSIPRGHHYALVDESRCIAPKSPQAAFMLKALHKAGKRGLTRSELVALAIKDPKGFPTNQPHDHAIGFFLSKFKTAGGLKFAE